MWSGCAARKDALGGAAAAVSHGAAGAPPAARGQGLDCQPLALLAKEAPGPRGAPQPAPGCRRSVALLQADGSS